MTHIGKKAWLIESSKDGKKWRVMNLAPFASRREAEAKARHFEAGVLMQDRKWKYRAVQYVPVMSSQLDDLVEKCWNNVEKVERAELRRAAIPTDAALSRGRFA